jgi:hypothetical protein
MRSLESERDEDFFDVRFGRNRLIKWVGGALVGSATAFAMRAAPAEAHHNAWPYPCQGAGKCHYCSGRICTRYCTAATTTCPWGNGQCWNTCGYGGLLYRCCDWVETFPEVPAHLCICVELWSSC